MAAPAVPPLDLSDPPTEPKGKMPAGLAKRAASAPKSRDKPPPPPITPRNNKDGHLVYHAAALGIVYDKEKHEQYFFHGHDDDITALAMSPKDRLTICTGQLGKDAKILVCARRWAGAGAVSERTRPLCVRAECVSNRRWARHVM